MTTTAPETFTDVSSLLDFLQLDTKHPDAIVSIDSHFPLRVPLSYASRMQAKNWRDPLLKQVLADHAETFVTEGYSSDPVGDLASMPVPGLLHKYHGRALLITTGACAIHCRYCFRREYPYQEAHGSGKNLDAAMAYVSNDASIQEVLLSGGDPLSLNNRKLFSLLDKLNAIPHLQRIRIHTRQPVAIPQRLDDELIQRLASNAKPVVMVVHINHANEIDADLQARLLALKQTGITVLNQAVLLHGVNDDIGTLKNLSERLFAAGVLPYYLNLLDKVKGTQHFMVDDQTGIDLVAQLRQQLPGYLVPRLIRETAGQPSKTLIG